MREGSISAEIDPGLFAVCGVAGFYRIGADPGVLRRELSLHGRRSEASDLVAASRMLGLKSKLATKLDRTRFSRLPLPAIVKTKSGDFSVLIARSPAGAHRLVDPVTKIARDLDLDALTNELEPIAVLTTRRFAGEGRDPTTFGFSWFLPSLWRYRKPLSHVLLASLFVQIFALTTPIFFQIVVDKVLTHKTYSTLYVLAAGMGLVGLFDVLLQYLRAYVLSHTTNRIDVELGRRLFRHLTRLPISYFETRAAGQTVARVRELENIRGFLTGQALFSALDFVFAFVFIGVLFAYSWRLASIVLASAPIYLIIGFLIRPPLRSKVKEKFNRGAASQQFLVETIVGMQTVKAAAVEPAMQAQWEERLAAYVKTSFQASMLAAVGQNLIQYVSKFTNVLILLFGAYAVMDGDLSVGALIAFNMIAAQTIAPLLRLSQLWQDFQQVQVSVDRLGDILNHPPERASATPVALPRPRGDIELKHVTFRYKPGARAVLTDISLNARAGEVVGIVGPSGSGKSTLSKLIQRMYVPESGRIAVDGVDISQVDPSWLRGHIGVVLQDSLLFNRSIHENIAFANPAMPRAQVMAIARLTGADEFICQLPEGYDTLVEERGANLSGGQRQRIAIARALTTNPPILIFDEATSALDYESEQLIQKNMEKIVHNRTVIVIAHRLAAVRGCNRIFGVQDGRLVEVGSHSELIGRKGGLYARLWALQTEGVAA
jgi:ATP-binding cassette, subfamily B, bacterial HlyB/CyaB